MSRRTPAEGESAEPKLPPVDQDEMLGFEAKADAWMSDPHYATLENDLSRMRLVHLQLADQVVRAKGYGDAALFKAGLSYCEKTASEIAKELIRLREASPLQPEPKQLNEPTVDAEMVEP